MISIEAVIRNGDYVPCGNGDITRLTDRQEILQRVLFRLTARRGAFPFLPTLGSRLHLIGREKPALRQSAAEQYVMEALADESAIKVEKVSITTDSPQEVPSLRISLKLSGQSETLHVPLQ